MIRLSLSVKVDAYLLPNRRTSIMRPPLLSAVDVLLPKSSAAHGVACRRKYHELCYEI
jgi:hypothetical protein